MLTMVESRVGLTPDFFCSVSLPPSYSGDKMVDRNSTLDYWNDIKLTEYIRRRFWEKVSKNEGSCWKWMGYRNDQGYGVMSIGTPPNACKYMAHRISYVIHFKEDPRDQLVLHKCDNPQCTNPDHLFLGTLGDNLRDCYDKGRRESPMKGKILCEHPTSMFIYYEPYYEIWAMYKEGWRVKEISEAYKISWECAKNIVNNVTGIVTKAIKQSH